MYIHVGVRKNWQERWFVLDFASQLLTYFENREVCLLVCLFVCVFVCLFVYMCLCGLIHFHFADFLPPNYMGFRVFSTLTVSKAGLHHTQCKPTNRHNGSLATTSNLIQCTFCTQL